MKKLILFTFCLLSTLSITKSVNIDCRYAAHNYYMLKRIYSCIIRTVTSPDYDTVSVSGNHVARSAYNDVMGIFGNIGNVQKFPKGMANFFKNLHAIHFNNGHIKVLDQDDLKPFPDLVELYFDRNKIEVIEEGTFDFNPKLAGISFMSNRLYHISANVFDHLYDLKYLWLNGNAYCPNGATANNRNAVMNLIVKAKETCQSAAYLKLQRKVKGISPTLLPQTQPPPTVYTITATAETCTTSRPTTPCPKCSTKWENISDIFDGYSNETVNLQAKCEMSGNTAYKTIIEDFVFEYGNMHSEFSHTLYLNFEYLKGNLSQICV